MELMTMDGAALQHRACDVAAALPGVSDGHPFTRHLLVYKVAGRVFLIVTEDPDEQIITVKAEPQHADGLVREHENVQRGRYLDKHHWISVGPGGSVTESFVDDLVHDSYDLVVDRLPADVRDDLRAASMNEGGRDDRHE